MLACFLVKLQHLIGYIAAMLLGRLVMLVITAMLFGRLVVFMIAAVLLGAVIASTLVVAEQYDLPTVATMATIHCYANRSDAICRKKQSNQKIFC